MSGIRSRRHTGSVWATPSGSRWATVDRLRGKRVAIVNDVINAGSAVRGTLASLKECGAQPIAIGTLAVYGDAARDLAATHDVALEALASFPSRIWEPSACPLCAKGVPLNA